MIPWYSFVYVSPTNKSHKMTTMTNPDPATKRPRPHAAVCFWGCLHRSINQTHEGIRKHLMGPLRESGFIVDVYAHGFCIKETTHLAEDAVRVLGCRAAVLEIETDAATATATATQDDATTFDTALLLELYSLERVTQLWSGATRTETGGKYDVILYARPDAVPCTPLSSACITRVLSESYAGRAMAMVSAFVNCGGINDTFVLATPSAAWVWGTRWRAAPKHAHGAPLRAETFLKHVLRNAGVRVESIPLRLVHFRADGSPRLDDFFVL